MKPVAVAGLFVLLCANACAADLSASRVADPASLSLRQAETLFLANNPSLALARHAVEGSRADVLSADRNVAPPVISYNASSIDTRRGIGAGSLPTKQMDQSLRVDMTLERGDKRALRTEAANARLVASQDDLANAGRSQLASLRTAYYDLLMAQEKRHIADDSATLAQKMLDVATLRLQAGDISPVEVSRIRVDALHTLNDVRQTQADQRRAQESLAYLIGQESNAPKLTAVDDWPAPTDQPLPADLDRMLDGRPDVLAAQARLTAAEKALRLAHALRKRDLTVGVMYERFPGQSTNNGYGIGLSAPLATDGYYSGEIGRAEADRLAAETELARVRAAARGDILRSQSDLSAAAERVERFRSSLLDEARRAAEGAEFAYRHGAIGVTDLLDARRTYHAIRIEAVTAQADYAKALAAWQAALSQGESSP